jgi:hypothetical protein
MTAEQILSDVLRDLHGNENDPAFSSRFWRAIVDVQLDFCNRRRWGFLIEAGATVATTASTQSVTLASDFDYLFADDCVRDTTNESWLERISTRSWYDRRYEDGSTEGAAGFFWIQDQTMYFTPTPDSADTILYSYYKQCSTPTANSPALTVPDEYRETIYLMVTKAMIRTGMLSLPEHTLTHREIAARIEENAMHDHRRYKEARAAIPRAARTMRHG